MGHSIDAARKHDLEPRDACMYDAVDATNVGGHLDVNVTPLRGPKHDDG